MTTATPSDHATAPNSNEPASPKGRDAKANGAKHRNADPAELAKFGELAHRWWDLNAEFKPLHALNPLRLDWIEQTAGLKGKKVLDIGCGGGILADSMARRDAQVLGIDLATKALKVAQLHAIEADTPNVTYREISAEDLAAQVLAAHQGGDANAKYDVVTCMEMLEHVPDPTSVVRACAQMVKPGGWVFFSTINRNPKAWLLAVVGAEYVLNLLPKGTHEYMKFITPAEMASHCRAAGLRITELRGLQYNPLTKRYWHDQDTSVNYMIATQLIA